MMRISYAARLYALWELSRRAGVTLDWFDQWQIAVRADALVVHLRSAGRGEIRFPFFLDDEWQPARVVRKRWSREVPKGIQEQVASFVVPFCRRESIPQEPLFVQENQQAFNCTEDLLASILLTLCRYEESDPPERDVHGRFPASASVAFRHGYLRRPIVDEYGLAFQQVLETLVPGWSPVRRALRVKLSHDIDLLGIPFSISSAIGHACEREAPLSCVRDLLSLATPLEPTYLRLVRTLCTVSSLHGLHSALYWKDSSRSVRNRFNTGYDLRNPKIVRVIEWAKKQGVEMGVHPGYDTFLARGKLREEVERCRKGLNQEKIGGRQHYLRWCPATWEDWESCDLAYDSTVGFPDQIGFRAGTCIPYLPWLLKADRCADLLEIPLVATDGAIVQDMRPNSAEGLRGVLELRNRCACVGGVFTVLWHNSSLLAPYAQYYPPILEILGGTADYDWERDAETLRHQTRLLRERCYTSAL